MTSGLLKRIRGYFAAGLLFLVPLVLTIYIVTWLFLRLDGLLNEQVSRLIYHFIGSTQDRPIPGIGLIALLLVIFLVGFFVRNYFGRKLVALSQWILSRIPVIKHVYGTLHQISDAFLSDRRETFKYAALFEYPRKGVYSIGFITQDTKGSVQKRLGEEIDVYSIFLPTTPNPTSGYLLFVPKKDVIILDITVEEALKLVISGGSITPQERQQQDKTRAFYKKLSSED